MRPVESFTLTGPTVTLDPRTHAVRRDIADIRLADRVFAPHYVVPMPRALVTDVALREASDSDAVVMADLAKGDVFEVLELVGSNAWGKAVSAGLVGYIDIAALGESSERP